MESQSRGSRRATDHIASNKLCSPFLPASSPPRQTHLYSHASVFIFSSSLAGSPSSQKYRRHWNIRSGYYDKKFFTLPVRSHFAPLFATAQLTRVKHQDCVSTRCLFKVNIFGINKQHVRNHQLGPKLTSFPLSPYPSWLNIVAGIRSQGSTEEKKTVRPSSILTMGSGARIQAVEPRNRS